VIQSSTKVNNGYNAPLCHTDWRATEIFRVLARYKPLVKWGIRVLTALSIILGFFAFPAAVAVPFAVLCAVAGWLANNILFRHPYILVHAGTDLIMEERNARIGFVWSKRDLRGRFYPELSVLYETRRAAKFAYSVFRSWNNNRYIDEAGNIVVSVVHESGRKYTVFLYPGARAHFKEQVQAGFFERLPADSEPYLASEMKPFYFNSADYSDRPEMMEFFEWVRGQEEMLLNSCYVRQNTPVPYARHPLRIQVPDFHERSELTRDMIEYHKAWDDPNKACPETVARVSELSVGKPKPEE